MAQITIYEQLRGPGNTPAINPTVTVRAAAPDGSAVYDFDLKLTLADVAPITVDSFGNYAITVTSQDKLSPAGTAYVFDRYVPGLGLKSDTVYVPPDTARVWLGDLVTNLSTPGAYVPQRSFVDGGAVTQPPAPDFIDGGGP